MDDFEKAEKLKEKAGVTYEEAREALKMNDGNLLDAMIYLEKQGKAQAPEQGGSYSTTYDAQSDYTPVEKTVQEQRRAYENRRSVVNFFRYLRKIILNNTLVISRSGNEIITLPVWAAFILLLMTMKIMVPAVVISLFFGIRYSFRGPDDLETANNVFEKAGEAADRVKEVFTENKQE